MLGIFGGAFDPPTIGHLMAATYALTMDERIGTLIVVPSLRHPWKPDLKTPLEHRAAMLRLLFAPLGGALTNIVVDDAVEERVAANNKPSDEPVYTIEVIEHYIANDRHPILVVGQDEADELTRWHRYDDLIRLAGPPCVVPRGCTKNVHVCDISSTFARALLVQGRFDEAATFVPKGILRYIEAHRLYMTTRWARTREA